MPKLTSLLTCLIWAGALLGCRQSGNPYRVEIDAAPLIQGLGTDDEFERDPIVTRLAAMGPPVLPALQTALHREPVAVRVGVVDVLESMGDAAAVPLLIEATTDRDPQVAAESLRVLAFVGDDRAQATVEAALRNPDSAVRRSAMLACGWRCGSPEAIRTLARLALTDEGELARQSLRRLATEAGPPRASEAQAAARAAAIAVRQRSDATAGEQLHAAALLAAIGDASAADWIVELAAQRDAGTQRASAVLALAGLTDRAAAVAALAKIATLPDADLAVRSAACTGLGALSPQRTDAAAAAERAQCAATQAGRE